MLVVLFPFGKGTEQNWAQPGQSLANRLRIYFHSHMWRRRMRSYQIKVAISEYSREWTKKRWGVNCGILNPPCNTKFAPVEKQRRILSVGRFTPLKRQLDLLHAYRELKASEPESWEYRTVGPLGADSVALDYYERVKAAAEGTGAQILTDLPRKALTAEFETAGIFWHGAGYTEGPEEPPEVAEHFGITTVEAMAAGCVPVVINKGGQPELVRHGLDGFVWNTLAELIAYTRQLQNDPDLRQRMSDSARSRAQNFSREAYLRNFDGLLAEKFRI